MDVFYLPSPAESYITAERATAKSNYNSSISYSFDPHPWPEIARKTKSMGETLPARRNRVSLFSILHFSSRSRFTLPFHPTIFLPVHRSPINTRSNASRSVLSLLVIVVDAGRISQLSVASRSVAKPLRDDASSLLLTSIYTQHGRHPPLACI